MPASNSFLQLDTYFLKEISYTVKNDLNTIPEKVSEIKSVNLEVSDLTTPIEETENAWRCELVIKSSEGKTEGNPFYNFKIVMVGFFKVDSALPDETAKALAESNCPAVLYSTSREIIATVTRRSPYPAVLLPLVTFVKNLEQPKKKKRTIKKKSE